MQNQQMQKPTSLVMIKIGNPSQYLSYLQTQNHQQNNLAVHFLFVLALSVSNKYHIFCFV